MAYTRDARAQRVISYGGFVFVAGQTAQDSMARTLAGQMKVALARIERQLQAAGSDKAHLLSVMMLLHPGEDCAQARGLWEGWLEGEAPAALHMRPGVTLAPGARVEISVAALHCQRAA